MAEAEDLTPLLDPNRDYGDRSYEQVVADVRDGTLGLEPGRSLPVIRDRSTNLPVKGTGQPPVPTDLPRWGRKRFQERAAADFDAVYEALVRAAKRGDVRAQKLFIETFLGRPRETANGVDEHTFEVLLALARETRTRSAVVELE